MLKNSAAVRAAANPNSFMTRVSPIASSNLAGALDSYRLLMGQYQQMLDAVIAIAGPSMTPMGAPPAAPDAIVTVNATLENATILPAVDPWLSDFASGFVRDGVTPVSFVLDRQVTGPMTLLSSGTVPAYSINAGAAGALPFSGHVGVAAMWSVRMQFYSGVSAVPYIGTWTDFIESSAKTVLQAYQDSLRHLMDRIKATAVPADAALATQLWNTIHGPSPEHTQILLDQVRVLRYPNGLVCNKAPSLYHAGRDQAVANVVAVIKAIPESTEI